MQGQGSRACYEIYKYFVIKYSTLVPQEVPERVLLWLVKNKVEPALEISRRAERATIDGHSWTERRLMLETLS